MLAEYHPIHDHVNPFKATFHQEHMKDMDIEEDETSLHTLKSQISPLLSSLNPEHDHDSESTMDSFHTPPKSSFLTSLSSLSASSSHSFSLDSDEPFTFENNSSIPSHSHSNVFSSIETAYLPSSPSSVDSPFSTESSVSDDDDVDMDVPLSDPTVEYTLDVLTLQRQAHEQTHMDISIAEPESESLVNLPVLKTTTAITKDDDTKQVLPTLSISTLSHDRQDLNGISIITKKRRRSDRSSKTTTTAATTTSTAATANKTKKIIKTKPAKQMVVKKNSSSYLVPTVEKDQCLSLIWKNNSRHYLETRLTGDVFHITHCTGTPHHIVFSFKTSRILMIRDDRIRSQSSKLVHCSKICGWIGSFVQDITYETIPDCLKKTQILSIQQCQTLLTTLTDDKKQIQNNLLSYKLLPFVYKARWVDSHTLRIHFQCTLFHRVHLLRQPLAWMLDDKETNNKDQVALKQVCQLHEQLIQSPNAYQRSSLGSLLQMATHPYTAHITPSSQPFLSNGLGGSGFHWVSIHQQQQQNTTQGEKEIATNASEFHLFQWLYDREQTPYATSRPFWYPLDSYKTKNGFQQEQHLEMEEKKKNSKRKKSKKKKNKSSKPKRTPQKKKRAKTDVDPIDGKDAANETQQPSTMEQHKQNATDQNRDNLKQQVDEIKKRIYFSPSMNRVHTDPLVDVRGGFIILQSRLIHLTRDWLQLFENDLANQEQEKTENLFEHVTLVVVDDTDVAGMQRWIHESTVVFHEAVRWGITMQVNDEFQQKYGSIHQHLPCEGKQEDAISISTEEQKTTTQTKRYETREKKQKPVPEKSFMEQYYSQPPTILKQPKENLSTENENEKEEEEDEEKEEDDEDEQVFTVPTATLDTLTAGSSSSQIPFVSERKSRLSSIQTVWYLQSEASSDPYDPGQECLGGTRSDCPPLIILVYEKELEWLRLHIGLPWQDIHFKRVILDHVWLTHYYQTQLHATCRWNVLGSHQLAQLKTFRNWRHYLCRLADWFCIPHLSIVLSTLKESKKRTESVALYVFFSKLVLRLYSAQKWVWTRKPL